MSGRQNEAETGISGATEIGTATETATETVTETGIATETGTATEVTGIESLDAAGGGAGAVETAADRRRREAARWRTGCATSPGWPMTDPVDPAAPAEEGEGKTCGKTAETTADPAAPEAWSEDPRWVSQRTKQKLNKNGKFGTQFNCMFP